MYSTRTTYKSPTFFTYTNVRNIINVQKRVFIFIKRKNFFIIYAIFIVILVNSCKWFYFFELFLNRLTVAGREERSARHQRVAWTCTFNYCPWLETDSLLSRKTWFTASQSITLYTISWLSLIDWLINERRTCHDKLISQFARGLF